MPGRPTPSKTRHIRRERLKKLSRAPKSIVLGEGREAVGGLVPDQVGERGGGRGGDNGSRAESADWRQAFFAADLVDGLEDSLIEGGVLDLELFDQP